MLEKIKELHSRWLTNRQIAKAIWLHHTTIWNKIKIIWLIPNGNWPKKLNIISETEAVCSKCSLTFLITDFQYSHTNKWRLSYCNNCRNKQTTNRINCTLESFLKHRILQTKTRAKKIWIPFNMDYEFVLWLYNSQYWNCFYTDKILDTSIWKWHNDNALSFDRVVPELWYIQWNIVLCTNKVNTCKNSITLDEMSEWMPWWYERVKMWREAGLRCLQVANGNF